jgi:acyl-CoA synthetase (AMP-forming)/AMP-acid ligase II
MDFIKAIRDIFKNNSERTFIIESQTKRQFSYADFYNMAYRAATFLRSKNIERYDRVMLLLNNSVEFVALYFACLFTGAVAMPVNPALHTREIDFIINHSDPKLII